MIDTSRLLGHGQRLVRALEDDLRERLAEHPALAAQLEAEHARARESQRTGQSFAVWRDEQLTQVAVHWVLAAVFVRFLEDNALLPAPWIAGPGARHAEALDRQERFFAATPSASDRDYLLAAFRDVERLPAMAPLFDERHNPLFRLGPSADGAKAILELFRRHDGAGARVHDFADPEWNTRFLGDLYQDLSEAARKRFALLQTPEFVEEFLLDRTLEPAIEQLGLAAVRLIDPACGSGHFLLGAFHRLFDRWQRAEAGTNERELARRALDQIAGVDLNPFAVAIARFRLLVAALRASDLHRLADAPAFPLHLAAGDSLLHGRRPGYFRATTKNLFGEDPLAHVYDTEDADALREILERRYSVVVANPPYITPKDARINEEYRDRFGSCSGKYSLAVPFTERFFDLAERGAENTDRRAGWVGVITANSFMKREFGKKLIESYLPKWDLTHLIDTSGAYIPGHGTPTVLLIARNRPPLAATVRAVMGIRGEPSTPDDPAHGQVWTAIVRQVDVPGSESEFVSVADLPRERLAKHPWSIGGGGAADLKETLEEVTEKRLAEEVDVIGRTTHTGEDECFFIDASAARSKGLTPYCVPVVLGGVIRDWHLHPDRVSIFPYSKKSAAPLNTLPEELHRHFWPLRSVLRKRQDFGQTPEQRGLFWYEHSMFFPARYLAPLGVALAFVATHNHFVLDRGGKIFNRTAPVIKLPEGATEDDHLALLGLLNSSTACFWMKQVFYNRGSTVDQKGARQRTLPFEDFWEHDSTKLLQFPLPTERPLDHARDLDRLAGELAASSPHALLQPLPHPDAFASSSPFSLDQLPTRTTLDAARARSEGILGRMIALQEEFDWQTYRLYGLLTETELRNHTLEADPATTTTFAALPEVALGERPFEIALARRVAAGEIQTQWFARHDSTPITHIPDRWPAPYRDLVERRLRAIAENSAIALIEQPEFKRRWNREPWEAQERDALRAWLLDRLESPLYWPQPRLASAAQIADRVRRDGAFRQIAALYRGRDDFDLTELITELALDEAVPYLAAWRYSEAGLRKRAEWEETWRRQRLEDEIDARTLLPEGDPERLSPEQAKAEKAREEGDILVPPRYGSADYRKTAYWRLRGKLDVPKERFLLYPGLEDAVDPTAVLGWAGWTHLEQAEALGHAYHHRKENEAWPADRLAPLLAGLLEIVPWLLQWHNQLDAQHGQHLGDFYRHFVDEEARALALTREQLKEWQPQAQKTRRKSPK